MSKERELQVDDEGYKGYWVSSDNGEHFFIRENETAKQAWGRHMQNKSQTRNTNNSSNNNRENSIRDNNGLKDEIDYKREYDRHRELGYDRDIKTNARGINYEKFDYDMFGPVRGDNAKENRVVGGDFNPWAGHEREQISMSKRERDLFEYDKTEEWRRKGNVKIFDNTGPADKETPVNLGVIEWHLRNATDEKDRQSWARALKNYEDYYSESNADTVISREDMMNRRKRNNTYY